MYLCCRECIDDTSSKDICN